MGDQENVDTPPHLAGNAYLTTVRAQAAELKTRLINQTLDDVASFQKATDQLWANAHSGKDPVERVPASNDELAAYRTTVQNDYYAWVEPTFERYLLPDPDAANAMIDALATIEGTFQGSVDNAGRFIPTSPALSRITDARIDMDHWEGGFQEDFVLKFLSPLETVVHNEGVAAKYARELLLLNKVHYIRYRQAVLNLIDTAIKAVTALNTQRDPKKFLWGTLAAVSIGTALSIGSGGLAVLGAGGAIAGTLAQGLVPDPPDKNDLAAPTAQEIAVNVASGLVRLDRDTYEKGEKDLEAAFRRLYTTISEARAGHVAGNTSGPLNVARPLLDDASAADILRGSFVPGSSA
jgi:hypothetical protein